MTNGVPRRYVACLDVLGFSKALESDLLGLANAYSAAIKIARNMQESARFVADRKAGHTLNGMPLKGTLVRDFPHIMEVAVFSDSIFIFTEDESADSLTEICEYCFLVYREFLRQLLPLRGGITRGEAIVIPKDRLYLGQAIVDAWTLEQSLDLTGIVLKSGLNCAASVEAEVTFAGGHKERLHVPTHRTGMVHGRDHIRNFEIIRAKAIHTGAQKMITRYENSEPVVAAAMLKIDREALRLQVR